MTVIELARFQVHEDGEQQLLAERPAMIREFREHFPACLAAYLTREDDGSWLDVLVWRSRADAEAAASQLESLPAVMSWLRHIAHSDELHYVEVVDAAP